MCRSPDFKGNTFLKNSNISIKFFQYLLAEDIPKKDAYVAIVLIRSDARNTRPPYTRGAFSDQILYVMTDADDDFKGKKNPNRIVIMK